MMLWLGGCPKRQERQSVVVYVPTPPAAAAPAPARPELSKPEVLVIEEPAPPPEEASVPQPSSRPPVHRRNSPAPAPQPVEPDEPTTPDVPAPPPAEVPALESRESTAQESERRHQYAMLAQDVQQRLQHLKGTQLSANDRHTLEDAHAFFVQSTQAFTKGDLLRALNLANKASLLLAALE